MVKTQIQQNTSRDEPKQKQAGTQETKISWYKKKYFWPVN
jgi:hypothetical protein